MNNFFKQVASQKFDALSETRKLYPEEGYKEAVKEFGAAADELRMLIGDNEELLKAYWKLDSAFGEYESYVDEQCFIKGFMEGIKFLNRLKKDLQSMDEEEVNDGIA